MINIMKKLFIILLMLISINTFADTYSATGQTENYYGDNYSISLQIDANCFYNTCTINKVYAYINGSWSYVSYNPVYGKQGKYQIFIDGDYYYFYF